MFIYSLTDFDSRVTVDIDFLLRKMPNTPEQLKKVINEIINTPIGNEFITFEITEIAPISVAKKYAGISASLLARIKNTKTLFRSGFVDWIDSVISLSSYDIPDPHFLIFKHTAYRWHSAQSGKKINFD